MVASDIREIDYPLPSKHLDLANWVDCFEISSTDQMLDAHTAVGRIFDTLPPRWVRMLGSLRNRVVSLVGLQGGEISIDGEKAGAFPVLYRGKDAVVCGFDDWHLNFRVVVETPVRDSGRVVTSRTLR